MVVVLMLYRRGESAHPTPQSWAARVSLDKLRAADTEIRGQVMGVLAFDDMEQFEAWKHGGGLDRFPGCGYRLFNRVEDMRNSNFAFAGFNPKCRHCKHFPEVSPCEKKGCRHPKVIRHVGRDTSSNGCKHFEEG